MFIVGQKDIKIGIESRKERSVRILKFGIEQLQNTDGWVSVKASSEFRSILDIVDHFATLAC